MIIRPTARTAAVPLQIGTPIYGADPTGGTGASLCPMAAFLRAVATKGITPGGRGAPGSPL